MSQFESANPLDTSFSYHTLNPREDQSTPRVIFTHPDAVFPLSGYPEFGKPSEVIGCSYQESDLLYGIARNGLPEAEERVGNNNTPRYFQESLRIRKGEPSILLRHVLVGCNVGNGYPYLRLGYTTSEIEDAELQKYQKVVAEKRVQLAARGVVQRSIDSLMSAMRGDSLSY